MNFPSNITLEQLSTPLPAGSIAHLDLLTAFPANARQAFWRGNGYVIMRGLIPDPLIDAYLALREPLGTIGFRTPTPYLQHAEVRDLALYPPLCAIMEEIVGEPVGLHLNLAGLVSTERDWHQDAYLSPTFVGTKYIASWIALDTINEDCGPLELVPGSHKWPPMDQAKLFQYMTPDERSSDMWPWTSEAAVASLFTAKIKETNSDTIKFTAQKGDVLLWHNLLAHRGSAPKIPGTPRKALISHYSALSVRHDMPKSTTHKGGGYYFLF